MTIVESSSVKCFKRLLDCVDLVQYACCINELRKVLFLAPSVCGFLFVYEISRKPLNGSAQNSHGRRVWSLARTSLKVKVKGQGHQGQKVAFFDPFGGVRLI